MRKSLQVALSLFLVFSLVGCEAMSDFIFGVDEVPVGRIRFDFGMAFPASIGYDITRVHVTMTHPDTGTEVAADLTVNADEETASGTITNLRVGVWDIVVELYEGETLIGTGTGTGEVTTGIMGSVIIDIILETGGLNIVVNWGSFTPSVLSEVFIAAGTFDMGSDIGDADETPIHSVTLTRSFYISTYEVSQAQWIAVMSTNPANFVGDNRPVEMVNWYDAIAFCNALSELEGLTPCYVINDDATTCDFDADGYRLPTEAEWEFAARGGVQSQGYPFSGDEVAENVAWHTGNADHATHDVGMKVANELGIYDMSGNVFEWVWDWFESYPDAAVTDPTGPVTGSYRVLRGGGWYADPSEVRVANRYYSGPSPEFWGFGIRPVRTAD